MSDRLTAARDALEEAIGETWCAPTSGGTDGVWCMYHDRRMVDEERCEMRAGWVAALAAAAAPGPVAALEATPPHTPPQGGTDRVAACRRRPRVPGSGRSDVASVATRVNTPPRERVET